MYIGPRCLAAASFTLVFFSIVQRKVLTPNDFPSLAVLRERLLAFQTHYEAIAKPFEWKFTRRDLEQLLQKLAAKTGIESPSCVA